MVKRSSHPMHIWVAPGHHHRQEKSQKTGETPLWRWPSRKRTLQVYQLHTYLPVQDKEPKHSQKQAAAHTQSVEDTKMREAVFVFAKI